MTETSPSFGSDSTRRQLSRTVAATACVTLLVVGTIAVAWEGKPTPAFLVGVGGAFLAVTVVNRRTLARARAIAGSQPLTTATWVTLARGWLLIAFAGFLFTDPPNGPTAWVPAGLFAAAAGLDAIDGALARRTDAVSELGGRLDTEIDSLLVAVGAVTVVLDGRAPLVLLAVGGARYAFVGGIRWRRARDLAVYELDPSRLRRVAGAIVMLTVWIALLPVVDLGLSRAIATVGSIPVLFQFVRDWLFVSGRIDR
ncbi:CDP-alcohol phosphatidyltransferase family protein [Halorubrum sp. DTA98]|uniref:CDP-alcohol phosphatidyltransferase family protein n=1 Tax=Halorubrum sp. DTA98 TaxID=3402163 RepID=UPI003AAFF815